MKYRELVAALREFGIYENTGRGKGSERHLYHPNYEGKGPLFVTIKCHAEGDDVTPGALSSVLRRFGLKQHPHGSKHLARDPNKKL